MAVYRRGKTWWISYTVGGKRIRKGMGSKKADAVAILEKIHLDIRAGRYHEEVLTPLPFEDLHKKYIAWAKGKKSFDGCKASANACLEYFRGKLAHTITEHDVEAFRSLRKDTPIRQGTSGEAPRSNGTVNHELAALKHVFNKGVAWGLLHRNPAVNVKALPESKGRTRFLTVEEVGGLLDAASPHLRPILIMALETGMRRGEILNLKWSDVDMKSAMIYVGDTKTNVPRHIPMSDRLRETLKALPRRLGTDYVFTGSIKTTAAAGRRKRPLNQPIGKVGEPFQAVRTSFENALKRAGITGFRFHDLRHTAASHMVMAGVPMKTVGEILGHTTAAMTERYSHLTPEHKRAAVELLSASYDPANWHKIATNEKGVTG